VFYCDYSNPEDLYVFWRPCLRNVWPVQAAWDMYLVRNILLRQDYRDSNSCAYAIYFSRWSDVSSIQTFTITVLISMYNFKILNYRSSSDVATQCLSAFPCQ